MIRADDILEHYKLLKEHDAKLASVKVFQGFSHSDFTYGYNESLAIEFAKTFKSLKSGETLKGLASRGIRRS